MSKLQIIFLKWKHERIENTARLAHASQWKEQGKSIHLNTSPHASGIRQVTFQGYGFFLHRIQNALHYFNMQPMSWHSPEVAESIHTDTQRWKVHKAHLKQVSKTHFYYYYNCYLWKVKAVVPRTHTHGRTKHRHSFLHEYTLHVLKLST